MLKILSKTNLGVTFIELIMIVAFVSIIGATAIPIGSGFLVRNHLRNKTSELVSSLRTAQLNSLSGKENSQWGVNIESNSMVLFKGSSFIGRDQSFDELFTIPASITITPVEVVFDKVTGNPNTAATITIQSNANDIRTVAINQVGVVDVN